MKKIKVGINGFGRIGRAFYRLASETEEIEIVVINDLADIKNLAYLLKYDTAYGISKKDIQTKEGAFVIDGKEIAFLSVKDPKELPWKDMDIDVVIESTGLFATYEASEAHISAGAKKVVVSSPIKGKPSKDVPGATVLVGINEEKLSTCTISANASCTTNAAAPVVTIMEESLDIEKAILNTIHGVTSTQRLVDSPHYKDPRRGRAAMSNIIPTTTGAAAATTEAVEGINFFDGISVRVPVLVGSLVDITFETKKDTTVEEVNEIFRRAAGSKRWHGILDVSDESLVSSDIVGNTHASIVDLKMTKVVGGNLVKVLSWYDNETGYTNTLVRHVISTAKHI